ncbi:unnamed protein product [Sphagnum balticum]
MFADPSDLDAYVNEYVVEKILKIEHFRSQNRIFESTDGYAIPRGNGRRGPGAREAEIDYYLENGCVLVRGLNAKEEFEVLLKFRTFLLKRVPSFEHEIHHPRRMRYHPSQRRDERLLTKYTVEDNLFNNNNCLRLSYDLL